MPISGQRGQQLSASHLTQIPTEFKHEGLAVASFVVLGCAAVANATAGSMTADFFASSSSNGHHWLARATTACFMPLMLLVTVLVAVCAGRMPPTGRSRTCGYAALAATAAVVVLVGTFMQAQAPGVLLAAACVAAAGSGLAVSTVLGEAAYMPESCTRAAVIGMSVPGLAMSLLRVVIKAALPQAPHNSALASMQACWALAAALAAAGLLVHLLLLPRLDVVRHHREIIKAEQLRADIAWKFSEAGTSSIMSRFGSFITSQRASFINISMTGPRLQVLRSPSMLVVLSATNPRREEEERQHHQSQVMRGQSAGLLKLGSMGGSEGSRSSVVSSTVGSAISPPAPAYQAVQMQQLRAQFGAQLEAASPLGAKSLACSTPSNAPPPVLPGAANATAVGALCWSTLLQLNAPLYVAVLLVMMLTFAAFPAVIVIDVNPNIASSWSGWCPVLLHAAFSTLDFISRCVSGCHLLLRPIVLPLLAAARLLFVPLLVVVLIKLPAASSAAIVVLLVALVGMTHGYLLANIVVAVPRGLSPSAAELAAMINVVIALAGATVGALAGFCWAL